MAALNKNISVKIMLLLCMLMQGVMLYPHHHHGENDAPCLIYSHCQNPHEACCHDADLPETDRACSGHNHDCPAGVCATERDIVAGLRIDRAPDVQQFSSVWLGCGFATVAGITNLALADTLSARVIDKERPFVERTYLVYVTRASLLRAPTPSV